MIKKAVTLEQLLKNASGAKELIMQVAEAAAAELEQRPTKEEVAAAIADAVDAVANEFFTSVSDGKCIVASAITDKGIPTAEDATWQTMRQNILAIPTGDNEISLNRLTIVTPPNKLHYYYNDLFHESFDPAGMTFEAELEAFGVTLTIPVEQNYIELSPAGPLEEGTSQITAVFRFGSQVVMTQQAIELVHEGLKWSDIDQKYTWAEIEDMFCTWADAESV